MNLAVIERMAMTGDMSVECARYLVRCRAYKLRIICNRKTNRGDLADRDLIEAKEALRRNSHLGRSSHIITDLED